MTMDDTLYKVSYLDAPNGKVQVWRIWTDYDGTDYHLYAEAGQEGGKLRTTNHGKFQILDDAEFKGRSKMKTKTDKGYQPSKSDAQNDPIFLPMLALSTKNRDGSLKEESRWFNQIRIKEKQ